MFEKLYDGFKVVLEENFREKGVKIALEDEYDEAGLIKQVPVIKIECTDFYPAFDQPSTGEKEIETRWQLRHILSKKEKNIEAKARDLSLKLMLLFDDRVFTEYTYPAKYVNSMDDNIDEYIPYESWLTQFSIVMRVGRSDFDGLIYGYND